MKQPWSTAWRFDRLQELETIEKSRKIEYKGSYWNGYERGHMAPREKYKFTPEFTYEGHSFYGPKAVGHNYYEMMKVLPVYIDPYDAVTGNTYDYICNYTKMPWDPRFDCMDLKAKADYYHTSFPIGGMQHFAPDIRIGLELGMEGILNKVEQYRTIHGPSDFYDGLESVAKGMQLYIQRHADRAQLLADAEPCEKTRDNYQKIADMNRWLAKYPPRDFLEACQFTVWYIVCLNGYNGVGLSVGDIDRFLNPYYQRDKAAGKITPEEAIYDLACVLQKEDVFIQIGGMDENYGDLTNDTSFLVLEAVHRLHGMHAATNLGIRVHENMNPDLLHRAVEVLLEDKAGSPAFFGDKALHEGFVRNGYSMVDAVKRAWTGCHWCTIPGREYALHDITKVSFARHMDLALREMLADRTVTPSIEELWKRFGRIMGECLDVMRDAFDFHMLHMEECFPELGADLFCYGPIEKGCDASSWKKPLEFYNLCVDGMGLSVVADSFAAMEKWIEQEQRISWPQLLLLLDTNFENAEDLRLLLRNNPRYGMGGTRADDYAVRIKELFVDKVRERPTGLGCLMTPGLYTQVNNVEFGAKLGATPDGRKAGEMLGQGANPTSGYKEAGALTTIAHAVASVQCGYGNTVPIHMEIDPVLSRDQGAVELFQSYIMTYCHDLGGTLMNISVVDPETILAAHADPDSHLDLLVRVTGYSAYFATLWPELRQMMVDRIMALAG